MTETVGAQGTPQRSGDGGSPEQVQRQLKIPPESQAERRAVA